MSDAQKTRAPRTLRNDLILVAVITVIAAIGLFLWNSNRTQGTGVAVYIDGVQTAVYPLSENREVDIITGDEEEHLNRLVIRDGTVSVSEANCPDAICVKTRAATYVGETIVCLPHKLVIEIVASDADPGLDATI